MSEKPQAVREDGQEDLLEQIITQGLEKLNAPAQATATAEAPPEAAPSAPKQEPSGEAVHPANRRNKRSAVYLYLLVLFGAAFLMLLLAYFVQQRSSEDAISDLRDSMNLSRKELLDEIKDLEEQKDALSEELQRWKDGWKDDFAQWQKLYEEKVQEANDLWDQNSAAQEELYSWQSFWALELCYQAGDYERCAALLILQTQGQYTYRTPGSAQERYEEIVQAVIDAGILDEDYERHPDDYKDLLRNYYFNILLFGLAESGETVVVRVRNVSRETER